MRYMLSLIVDTDDDKEIEEVNVETDELVTKYLENIGNVGGEFVRLAVRRLHGRQLD